VSGWDILARYSRCAYGFKSAEQNRHLLIDDEVSRKVLYFEGYVVIDPSDTLREGTAHKRITRKDLGVRSRSRPVWGQRL
jgi:hypothetical protein